MERYVIGTLSVVLGIILIIAYKKIGKILMQQVKWFNNIDVPEKRGYLSIIAVGVFAIILGIVIIASPK